MVGRRNREQLERPGPDDQHRCARGYLDRLAALAPAQPVGIYSAAGTWATITGATTVNTPANQPFATTPNWVAGATAKTAPSFCGRTFTGGPVRYVQYVSGNIDHDYPC